MINVSHPVVPEFLWFTTSWGVAKAVTGDHCAHQRMHEKGKRWRGRGGRSEGFGAEWLPGCRGGRRSARASLEFVFPASYASEIDARSTAALWINSPAPFRSANAQQREYENNTEMQVNYRVVHR